MYPYAEQIEKNERKSKNRKIKYQTSYGLLDFRFTTFLLCNNITNFRKFGNSGLPKLLNLVVLSPKCRVFTFNYVLGMYVTIFSKKYFNKLFIESTIFISINTALHYIIYHVLYYKNIIALYNAK